MYLLTASPPISVTVKHKIQQIISIDSVCENSQFTNLENVYYIFKLAC